MGFYLGKNVLVTGGTGMIGLHLVDLLLKEGAHVRIVSLDEQFLAPSLAEFYKLDLREPGNCRKMCADMNFVFHLACVKGSPKTMMEKPGSVFDAMISFNTNMMNAARKEGVERYLFTSSLAVYSPSELHYEDDVWSTFPSEKDRFAGWAKRMGELQAEAYKIEYGWDKISIVRPANVYGPYDNFDKGNAMVVPSLIKKAVDKTNPLIIWGDGNQIRDFIHAEDVARGMSLILELGYNRPLNLGSGAGYSIKNLINLIIEHSGYNPEIIFDTSKPAGDKIRILDTTRALELGFRPEITLEKGIPSVMDWYRKNRKIASQSYKLYSEFS